MTFYVSSFRLANRDIADIVLESENSSRISIDGVDFSIPFVNDGKKDLINSLNFAESYDIGEGLTISGPFGHEELVECASEELLEVAHMLNISNPDY